MMTVRKPLSDYDAKRDFATSPEPRGKLGKQTPGRRGFFCVQKHLASHLHYDFRLEHNGVLMSWAVPKGPSLNPADKRMAVHVEDHPVAYGDFEGIIPSGYGAGIVMLWDRGTWTSESEDIDDALTHGELKFRLDGVKLRGSWVLVRTKRQMPGGRGEQWLLIKHRDRWAGGVDATQLGESVKSFGDFAGILAAGGTPDEWKTRPPVQGGEAGALLKSVMSSAQEQAQAKKKAKKSKPAVPAVRVAKVAAGVPPKFTNREKILFPKSGFTKGDLIDYYTRIAPLMLPQLAGRAVTFKRYPDGIDGKFFFEKRCPDHRPTWINTIRVPGEKPGDKTIDYCTLDSVESLQWAANLAAIELHVPLARAETPDTPTAMIFDLDPGTPADLADCIRIGLRLQALLHQLGLKSLAKTSGGKGLHILVPLNTSDITFAATKAFARAVAMTLQKDDPKRVTAAMAKQQRTGRVFIDWGQNDRDKTNACVFSVRARETPTLSWPFKWSDLESRSAVELPTAGALPPLKGLRRILKVMESHQTLPKLF